MAPAKRQPLEVRFHVDPRHPYKVFKGSLFGPRQIVCSVHDEIENFPVIWKRRNVNFMNVNRSAINDSGSDRRHLCHLHQRIAPRPLHQISVVPVPAEVPFSAFLIVSYTFRGPFGYWFKYCVICHTRILPGFLDAASYSMKATLHGLVRMNQTTSGGRRGCAHRCS
jgi:hypothetical protein